MTLKIFEIPDSPEELGPWLEQQLVGLDLQSLIAELEVVNKGLDAATDHPSQIQRELLEQILERGLSGLSEKELAVFLKYPQTLSELQDEIFIRGGDFWSSVPINKAHTELVNRTNEKVMKSVNSSVKPPTTNENRPNQLKQAGEIEPKIQTFSDAKPSTLIQHSFRWGGLLAMAASLLLLIAYLMWPSPASPDWGFEKPGLLTAQVKEQEFFASLRDAAKEWFNKTPSSRIELTQRLVEFRQGCETLINANHEQLSFENRNWLVDRCRAWATRIDQHLSDLRNDTSTFDSVLIEANQTIDSLIQSLNERSQMG